MALKRFRSAGSSTARTPSKESDDDDDERPEFRAVISRLLEMIPGNYDHNEGAEAVIMTVAHGDDIEPMAFPLDDARNIVTDALVALATCDDAFAQRLLNDHFAGNDEGDFVWPRQDPL
ncbi:hypothetical protein BH09PLA1_BH09PLA1_01460 [soil metagenome]